MCEAGLEKSTEKLLAQRQITFEIHLPPGKIYLSSAKT